MVLESLLEAYNVYKGAHVTNMVLKKIDDGYKTVSLQYYPLQLVQIYFNTYTYDKIVKDVSVTFGDQISAIGGTMGLFAGFSILSAVEVLYFVMKFFFSLVSRKQRHI